MGQQTPPGPLVQDLLELAVPQLPEAERQHPRTGLGAKPVIPDRVMAALMMIALLHKKKTQSAQFRFLCGKRAAVAGWRGAAPRPSRATYFRRYRRGHQLYQAAIRLQGERAIAEGVADPCHVAVDKSLVAALGPPWHVQRRRANEVPAGADTAAAWGYSEHDGWVHGFSSEVVVTAAPQAVVFPLLASADTASRAETRTFADKIAALPAATQAVLADSGYDANHLGERIEWDDAGRRTGKRFVCPENPRNRRPKTEPGGADAARARSRRRRQQRRRFRESRRGRRRYRRRRQTVEPFNQWFKSPFDLEQRVWHRGLDNNRTQILGALFVYQLLVRYNHRCGHKNGQVRWILDPL